jgi:hypothetical protein
LQAGFDDRAEAEPGAPSFLRARAAAHAVPVDLRNAPRERERASVTRAPLAYWDVVCLCRRRVRMAFSAVVTTAPAGAFLRDRLFWDEHHVTKLPPILGERAMTQSGEPGAGRFAKGHICRREGSRKAGPSRDVFFLRTTIVRGPVPAAAPR